MHRALALRRLVARGRPALRVLPTEGLGVVAARRRVIGRELGVAALAELGGTCTVTVKERTPRSRTSLVRLGVVLELEDLLEP